MIALGLTRRRKPPGHSLPHPVIRSAQNLLVPLKSQLSENLRPPLLHALAGECSPSNMSSLTSSSDSVTKAVYVDSDYSKSPIKQLHFCAVKHKNLH